MRVLVHSITPRLAARRIGRSRTPAVAALLLAVAAAVAPAAPAAAVTSHSTWDFANDFGSLMLRGYPNPVPHGAQAGVWHLAESTNAITDPAARDGLYTDFANRAPDNSECGTKYTNTDGAYVAFNPDPADCSGFTSYDFAGHSLIALGSSSHHFPAIEWVSPVSTTVSVAARFTQLQKLNSNGISGYIDAAVSGVYTKDVADPVTAVSGGQAEAVVPSLAVHAGDTIVVLLGDNGSSSLDQTNIGVTITSATTTWDVATDLTPFGITPTFGDSYGNPNVWSIVRSDGDGGSWDGSTSSLVTLGAHSYWPNDCNNADQYGFHDGVNVTANLGMAEIGATFQCAGTYEPGHVDMDETPDHQAVGVRWTSPINGTIEIQGQMIDRDSGGGNGTDWVLVKPDGSSERGTIPNGGQSPALDMSVAVTTGETVYFILDANGDRQYDTSQVDLTITDTTGGGGGDTTKPVVTMTDTPNGQHGWWTSEPIIHVEATDDTGVASVTCDSGVFENASDSGSTDWTAQLNGVVGGDTAGTAISCHATDAAGNVGDGSDTIKLDTLTPTVTVNSAKSTCSTPGNDGWCRGTQTVAFDAHDPAGGSGLVGPSSFTQSVVGEGGNLSVASGDVCDEAGNCHGITVTGYKVDTVPPTLTSITYHAAADGALPAADVTDFPATVGSATGSLSGSVGDATSGVVSVMVNGSPVTPAYTAGGPTWSDTGIHLSPGLNTFTVVATDAAGNTATTSTLSVTYSPDLDQDGVANNVDPHPVTAGTDFSDAALGGSTGGAAIVPNGRTFAVTDDAAPTAGVDVAVGGSGGNVGLTLAGKLTGISLATGMYMITDPSATTTVSTTSGGPAALTFTVNGETHSVVVAAGGTASVTETSANGQLTNVAVVIVAGSVTVDGKVVSPGTTLTIGASLSGVVLREVGTTVQLAATFAPTAGGSADPTSEPTDIAVGPIALHVTPKQWLKSGRTLVRVATWNRTPIQVVLTRTVNGTWTVAFQVTKAPTLASPTMVAMTIGDDSASTSVVVRH
jgi:hypothetical protein